MTAVQLHRRKMAGIIDTSDEVVTAYAWPWNTLAFLVYFETVSLLEASFFY